MAKTDDEQEKREKQALIGLRQRINEAFVRRDIAELDRALSPDFVATTPDGDLATRQHEIVKLETGELNLVSVVQQDPDVRLYDDVEKMAILRGVDKITGKMGAQEVTGEYRFTDVAVKRHGHWQFVASQSVALGPPPAPPQQPPTQPGQPGNPPA
jgi:hypothetical protein